MSNIIQGSRMFETLTVIDCPWLCYRAKYAIPELSYEGEDTHIIFGFFSQLLTLVKMSERVRFAFCWDSKKSFRKKVYSEYKTNRRKDLTEDEWEELNSTFRQMDFLRKQILPEMGFINVFHQTGLESDDLMAQLCLDSEELLITLITSDHDMYQCLRPHVLMKDPWKKLSMTGSLFERKHNLPAACWAEVKAIAGCSTDNIKGIEGVGEKMAIKYLLGKLPEGKRLNAIQAGTAIIERNRELVTLPHEKTKLLTIQSDKLDFGTIKKVLLNWGMRSLLEGNNQWWRKVVEGYG